MPMTMVTGAMRWERLGLMFKVNQIPVGMSARGIQNPTSARRS